jgi:hypothetical protein
VSNKGIGERAPWQKYLRVIRHDHQGSLKQEPEDQKADSRDAEAAQGTEERRFDEETVIQRLHAQNRPPVGSMQPWDIDFNVDVTSYRILVEAEALEREQQALINSAPIEQTYQEILALYVQSKHDQAAQLEGRIEKLLGLQQARLQRLQSRAPGFFSLSSASRAWRSRQAQCRARLRVLNHRLEIVREIKDGMGLYSPKIEELATRKMRIEYPELASDWDAMRLAVNKKREQEKTRSRSRRHSQGISRPNK